MLVPHVIRMHRLASLDRLALPRDLEIKLFLGHHVRTLDNRLIICTVVLAPPPQPTLDRATDNDDRDGDPQEKDNHAKHNRYVDAATLSGITCLVREGASFAVGLGTGFLVRGKDDPAEKVEYREDDRDEDGGCLGCRVVDDAGQQCPLALADEERTQGLPEGRQRCAYGCNDDWDDKYKGRMRWSHI